MAWQTEMKLMLRHMLGDIATTPQYSDSRLEELIIVAAQLTLSEVHYTVDYTIDVTSLTISPDPTLEATKDDAFVNLTLLKAACLENQASMRLQSRQGIKIVDGKSSVDTSSGLTGFTNLVKMGPCKAYRQAVVEYNVGILNPGEAIMGPVRTECDVFMGRDEGFR